MLPGRSFRTNASRRPIRIASLLAPLVLGALGCNEESTSPTTPTGAIAPAPAVAAAAAALAVTQISVGGSHACAITTDSLAYCWGSNAYGRLGDGTETQRLTPVRVAGGLRFVQISAGLAQTCGVTQDQRGYCWGVNGEGQLGDGTFNNIRLTPVEVAGGRRWLQIRTGSGFTCGTTTAHVAFCWGQFNDFGRQGTGKTGAPTPTRVAGGLGFKQVIAGTSHSCGTTTDDRAFCWGNNQFGELGDGTRTQRREPRAVAGGLKFARVIPAAGYFVPFSNQPETDDGITCGLTTDDKAYCWGTGPTGTASGIPLTPTRVAGGRFYRSISPGSSHTCAVTVGHVAYCWGGNQHGQMGTGGGSSSTPVKVAGGLAFSSVSVTSLGQFTCGVTTSNRAYCWGINNFGELGDGTKGTDRLTPVPVAGAS